VKYLEAADIIAAHRHAVFKKIKLATKYKIYPGLKSIPSLPELIPGVKEAGWMPNVISQRPEPRQKGPLYIFMKRIIQEMQDSTHSWPFVEPVAGVPDYYDIIRNPMGFYIVNYRSENAFDQH
jgi:histone acetyltransferase